MYKFFKAKNLIFIKEIYNLIKLKRCTCQSLFGAKGNKNIQVREQVLTRKPVEVFMTCSSLFKNFGH